MVIMTISLLTFLYGAIIFCLKSKVLFSIILKNPAIFEKFKIRKNIIKMANIELIKTFFLLKLKFKLSIIF